MIQNHHARLPLEVTIFTTIVSGHLLVKITMKGAKTQAKQLHFCQIEIQFFSTAVQIRKVSFFFLQESELEKWTVLYSYVQKLYSCWRRALRTRCTLQPTLLAQLTFTANTLQIQMCFNFKCATHNFFRLPIYFFFVELQNASFR